MTTKKEPTSRAAGNNPHYTFAVIDAKGAVTEMQWGLPSVTHILDTVLAKPALNHWMYWKGLDGVAELLTRKVKLPADTGELKQLLGSQGLSPYAYRDAAASKGRTLHDDLEHWCHTGEFDPDERTAGLRAWVAERGLTPEDIIKAEQIVVSLTHRYAGTLDLIYKDPATGRIILADLKTGGTVQWSHFVQCEAYKMAWEEMTETSPFDEFNQPIDETRIIHVNPKAGENGWAEKHEKTVDADTWRGILSVYRKLPERWKPEEVED